MRFYGMEHCLHQPICIDALIELIIILLFQFNSDLFLPIKSMPPLSLGHYLKITYLTSLTPKHHLFSCSTVQHCEVNSLAKRGYSNQEALLLLSSHPTKSTVQLQGTVDCCIPPENRRDDVLPPASPQESQAAGM